MSPTSSSAPASSSSAGESASATSATPPPPSAPPPRPPSLRFRIGQRLFRTAATAGRVLRVGAQLAGLVFVAYTGYLTYQVAQEIRMTTTLPKNETFALSWRLPARARIVENAEAEEYGAFQESAPSLGEINDFYHLLTTIRRAARDERVSSFVVNLSGSIAASGLGIAQIQELRSAIIEFKRLKKEQLARLKSENEQEKENGKGKGKGKQEQPSKSASIKEDSAVADGKSIDAQTLIHDATAPISPYGADVAVAYADSFDDQLAYYLFMKRLLDKLGINMRSDARHEYKGAGASFTLTKWTDQLREDRLKLLTSLNHQIVQDISKERANLIRIAEGVNDAGLVRTGEIDAGAILKNTIDHGPIPAEDAKRVGLVDGVLYRRQILAPFLIPDDNDEAAVALRSSIAKDNGKQSDQDDSSEPQRVVSLGRYFFATKREERQKKKKQAMKERGFFSVANATFFGDGDDAEYIHASKSFTIAPGVMVNIDKELVRNPLVGVVYLVGGIGRGSSTYEASAVVKQIHLAGRDPRVQAIVFRVDSPGGEVVAGDTIWEAITHVQKYYGKPVVASFGNYAASGGYYVAAHANKIVSNPGTITGSIGVLTSRPVLTEKFMDIFGLNVDGVKENDNAYFHSLFHDLSDQQVQQVGRLLDRIYDHFTKLVSSGRNLSLEQVDRVARGRVWTGEDAKKVGLVDELGGLLDAIKLAEKLGRESIKSIAKDTAKDLADQLQQQALAAGIELNNDITNEITDFLTDTSSTVTKANSASGSGSSSSSNSSSSKNDTLRDPSRQASDTKTTQAAEDETDNEWEVLRFPKRLKGAEAFVAMLSGSEKDEDDEEFTDAENDRQVMLPPHLGGPSGLPTWRLVPSVLLRYMQWTFTAWMRTGIDSLQTQLEVKPQVQAKADWVQVR